MIVDERDNQPVFIGRVGENNSRPVPFYIGDLLEKYPEATFSIVHKRPGDPAGYTVNSSYFEIDEKQLVWTPQSGDLAAEGIGELQIKAADNGDIIKTSVFKTEIKEALDNSADPPTPWESWVEQVEDAASAAEQAAEAAEAAVAHEPIIGLNGNWYTWDPETEEYVDTENPSRGSDATPDLIAKAYANLTFPVSKGTQCYYSGKLYEAKQDIATSEAWTAAHWQETNISDELTSLKSDIQEEKDINKAIVALFQHTAFTDVEAAAAYSTLYDLVYGSESPYQNVEYVQTDGASRIDTGVAFDGTKDIKVTLEMSFNGTLTYSENILNGWSAGGSVGISTVGSRIEGWWSDGGDAGQSDLSYVGEMTTCEMTIKAGTSTNTISVFSNTHGTSTRTRAHTNVANRTFLAFPLFALSKQDSFDYLKAGLRIKSVIIQMGEQIVRSMDACYRKSDGVIGFYDKINDVFYTNAGTGSFTKGGDIE